MIQNWIIHPGKKDRLKNVPTFCEVATVSHLGHGPIFKPGETPGLECTINFISVYRWRPAPLFCGRGSMWYARLIFVVSEFRQGKFNKPHWSAQCLKSPLEWAFARIFHKPSSDFDSGFPSTRYTAQRFCDLKSWNLLWENPAFKKNVVERNHHKNEAVFLHPGCNNSPGSFAF